MNYFILKMRRRAHLPRELHPEHKLTHVQCTAASQNIPVCIFIMSGPHFFHRLFTLGLFFVFTTATSPPVTTCPCNTTSTQAQAWILPSLGGSPSTISLASTPSQCWTFNKTAGGVSCIGYCAFLDSCSPTSPTFHRLEDGTLRVAPGNTAPDGTNLVGWCIDENRQGLYLQAYRTCIPKAPQQNFSVDGQGRLHESWSGNATCVTGLEEGQGRCHMPSPSPPPPHPSPPPHPTPPPPPPPSGGSPQIHNSAVACLHHAGWHDITGTLTVNGTYHVFQGCPGNGGWHHAFSNDLLNWNNSLGIDIVTLPEPYGKSSPCSGFAVLDDEGTPCVGFRQCTGNWPGRRPQVVPLELRCAGGPGLTNWSAPEYIFWFYFARSLPYDPPRPWKDTDGQWYALISADACNATVPCEGGGAAYLHTSPRLRGPGANWTLLGPMWSSNWTVMTPFTGATLNGELVTTGYVGNLTGDPKGGVTRVLTNNVCGSHCCSCTTGWYLGEQVGGPGGALIVDYTAPNATGMIDWSGFEVNASCPDGVGLAGLATKGYGQGQFYSMARTISQGGDQVTGGGRKSILGWIGGQTPAMQSLPRDLTLAADGSGLLQDFAPEFQTLRKTVAPGGRAAILKSGGGGGGGGGGSRGGLAVGEDGKAVRSEQVEVYATFSVAAQWGSSFSSSSSSSSSQLPPFGVRLLASDNGLYAAETGVNFTSQHTYLLNSAGPLLPAPSAAGIAASSPQLGEGGVGETTLISMHAIVDHSVITVIWNNKTAFTMYYAPRGATYELFGVDGTVVQGVLSVWDLWGVNNTGGDVMIQ